MDFETQFPILMQLSSGNVPSLVVFSLEPKILVLLGLGHNNILSKVGLKKVIGQFEDTEWCWYVRNINHLSRYMMIII